MVVLVFINVVIVRGNGDEELKISEYNNTIQKYVHQTNVASYLPNNYTYVLLILNTKFTVEYIYNTSLYRLHN